ncbi:uncharacterized protein METZ01_LOCUS234832 [marine metagenome]|uniref:Lipoprotein n=1 Tax=marine metagenome TaxID=408172 RepID=A0A382H3V9_9ZZZZ
MKPIKLLSTAVLMTAIVLAGCENAGNSEDITSGVAEGTKTPEQKAGKRAGDGTSPGKPTAPISISYDILNKPIVGSPVQVRVHVRSRQGPVNVRYSINDQSALMFKEGQVESLEIADPTKREPREVSVIPLREGRSYVNVSVEVDTPRGLMIRSMSVPIKVGSAPMQPNDNGERKEGPGGETVISMPAQESGTNSN